MLAQLGDATTYAQCMAPYQGTVNYDVGQQICSQLQSQGAFPANAQAPVRAGLVFSTLNTALPTGNVGLPGQGTTQTQSTSILGSIFTPTTIFLAVGGYLVYKLLTRRSAATP